MDFSNKFKDSLEGVLNGLNVATSELEKEVKKIHDSGTQEDKIELAKAFDKYKLDPSIKESVRDIMSVIKGMR